MTELEVFGYIPHVAGCLWSCLGSFIVESIQSAESANPVLEAINNGDPIIKVLTSKFLRHLNRATVVRWINQKRIPALKLGKNWVSTEGLIFQALKQSTTKTVDPASKNESHEKAVESLKRRGVIKTAKPFKA